VHSGAIGDQVAALMQAGIINNAKKEHRPRRHHRRHHVRQQAAARFRHCNPQIQFRSSAYTHGPGVLAQIERFTALQLWR